jgi:hypothetical protein
MQIPSMLPLLSSPFCTFFLPSILFFKGCVTWEILSMPTCVPVLSTAGMAMLVRTSKGRGDPCPHPWRNTRCSRSHGLDESGGFLGRGDLSSPTTFYPCGLSRPSPDSLCVFRREPKGPEEATPSKRRLAWQARNLLGSPPPAPRPRCDTASPKRLPLFEHRPRGYYPGLEEAPERNE